MKYREPFYKNMEYGEYGENEAQRIWAVWNTVPTWWLSGRAV